MRINVNGEERETEAGTVAALLAFLGIEPVRVAVEVNMDIIPKGEYGSTPLKEGDAVEIVQFVGGGRS